MSDCSYNSVFHFASAVRTQAVGRYSYGEKSRQNFWAESHPQLQRIDWKGLQPSVVGIPKSSLHSLKLLGTRELYPKRTYSKSTEKIPAFLMKM